MKTGTKIIITALAITGLVVWNEKKKYDHISDIFEKMTIKPYGAPRNIKFLNKNILGLPSQIGFDIDVILENNSNYDLNVSGYVAVLKTIELFYKGVHLGNAIVDINEISIPNKNTLIVHDVKVIANTADIIGNISNFQNINVNDISINAIVSVLGYDHKIQQ